MLPVAADFPFVEVRGPTFPLQSGGRSLFGVVGDKSLRLGRRLSISKACIELYEVVGELVGQSCSEGNVSPLLHLLLPAGLLQSIVWRVANLAGPAVFIARCGLGAKEVVKTPGLTADRDRTARIHSAVETPVKTELGIDTSQGLGGLENNVQSLTRVPDIQFLRRAADNLNVFDLVCGNSAQLVPR